ncbi:MAG: carboxypeptidase-like regulatory domain-containing protein [Gemmatimonadales bacterium]|nr:carboxypeptidase-like regulatory domain-containing protein [Candidatus Palauibacter denitrificans]
MGDEPGVPRYEPRRTRRACIVFSFFPSLFLVAPAGPVLGQEDGCKDLPSLQVTVVDASGNIPIPGAMLVVHWSDVEETPLRETVGAEGRFLLCAPQDAKEAVLWAELGDDSSEQATVALAPGEVREVELRVLLAEVRRGRLIGRVYDALTERQVATAAVSVTGHAPDAASNRQGRFILSDVRPGVRHMEVRRIGYAPLRYRIDVTPGVTTEVDIGLVPTPVEMEPIVATVARLRRLEIKGFYERKYWGELTGNGYFFSPEYIERWRPSNVRFLVVSNVPGITWRSARNRRMGAGFSNLTCKMSIIVDGFSWGGWPNIPGSQLAGVEVYKGPATLPAEFGGSDARCGAIVIWTK